MTAKILTHPLAPEAGGDAFHSGGRQFASKNDPDWKLIAAMGRRRDAAAGEEVAQSSSAKADDPVIPAYPASN